MSTKIAVNLPVKDLAEANRFFAELGFGSDKRLANENMGAGHHWDVFSIEPAPPEKQS
jgi:predicted lactoylglutathione lyase